MLIGYIVIVVGILLDQLLKLISILLAIPNQTLIKIVIPNVFEFHYLVNTGASFGIFEGRQDIFAIITVASLIIFGYFFTSIDFKTKKVYSLAITLFISGTLGNAIDRVSRSGVVDMLNIPILNDILSKIGISPFIFNLADLFMNLAIVLFIIDLFFLEKKRTNKSEEIKHEEDNI